MTKSQAAHFAEILRLLYLAIKRHDQNEQAKEILHAAIRTWRKREMEENFKIWPKVKRRKTVEQ